MGTRVVRYRPATGAVEVVVANVGNEVIGAGGSACVLAESARGYGANIS